MSNLFTLFYSLLFFFAPLILYPKTSEIFEFNKMLFVYTLTGIILTAWIIKSVKNKAFILHRTLLDLPLVLFLLSQIVSTIISINPHTSLWGYYSRFHGGLVSTICYLILFYGFVTNIKEKKDISLIITSLLTSTTLVSIYAILEHFGIDKNLWVQDVQNRVFSTLGQPNWLAAYLLSVFPLPLYLATRQSPAKIKSVYIFTSLLFFLAILFTKSQSGIAATFIILSIFFTYQLFKSVNKKSVIYPLIFIVSLSLVVGTPWTPNPAQIKDNLTRGGPLWPRAESYFNHIGLSTQIKPFDLNTLTPAEKDYLTAKEKGIRIGGSNSMEIRKVVWQGAISLGKKYPLFGTGVETFGYSYYWVRPVTHNLLSEWDFLYNKAHNEYLNFLATTGFVGLATYLFLIVSIINLFFNQFKSQKSLSISFPFFLGFISILITNFFGFSVVNIALFFFLFPAFIVAGNPDKKVSLSLPLHLPTVISYPIIFFIAFLWLSTIRGFFISDLNYNQAKNYLSAGIIKPALDALNKAHQINPGEPVFTALLAETEAQAAASIYTQLTSLSTSEAATFKNQAEETINSYSQLAINHSQEAITRNPYHTNFYKSKAKTEIYLSTLDPQYLNKAAKTLESLTSLAPTDAKIYYNLGIVYTNLHNQEASQRAFQKALELKPDYLEVENLLH